MPELITKDQAASRGLARYYTGEPCRKGHVSEKYVARGRCIQCCLEADARWIAKNPDRRREIGRTFYHKNREDCRKKWLRYKHRDYLDQIDTENRPDACECCGRTGMHNGTAIDHDHETLMFRGWLCHNCNKGLGNIGDNREGVMRVLRYLDMADARAADYMRDNNKGIR